MFFEFDGGLKDDKAIFDTGGIKTGEMLSAEMLVEGAVVLEIKVLYPLPNAQETGLVFLSTMLVQLVP